MILWGRFVWSMDVDRRCYASLQQNRRIKLPDVQFDGALEIGEGT